MATEDEIKAAAKAEMFKRLAAAELQRRQAKSHPSFEDSQRLIQQDEQSGARGGITAGLTSFVDGVPIVGPAALGAVKRGAAGISSLIDGEDYSTNLKQADRITQDSQNEHPIVSTTGKVAGAVAGTLPLVTAAPAMFGGGAGSLVVRSGLSGISGAGIGGADAAVRSGGDRESVMSGIKWGGGMGLAGPAVANLVGKGAKSLIEAGRNRLAARAAGIDPEALTFVRRAVNDDALDPAMVSQRFDEMGPNAMLADLGPNLQKQAGALAATPGRGQEIIRTALADRQAGANSRIASAIDDNLGPRSIVPSEVNATIQGNQQALGPQYGEVFRQPTRYDFTPITDELDRSIPNLRGDAQRSLHRVRSMMNIHNTDQVTADPRIAFETRQAIDGMLATETNPKVIGMLSETRQMLDDSLRDAVPRIKEVDANFAELARQREALQRGQTVLSSGREAPRPSELANEVQQGALPQNMQIGPSAVPLRLSQGARAEVERIVGNNANDVVALNRLIKGEGDWNRSRLATLFGQDKADRLMKTIDNERAFADTANTVTRNSETAARQAAQSELGGAGVGFGVEEAFKAGGFSGAARAAALEKGKQVAAALLPQSSTAARESLARTLVDSNRDNVVRALMATGGQAQAPALLSPVVKALMLGGGTSGAR